MIEKEEQRRSRIETINTILVLSVDGIKKTHIMYKANLSHVQLERYLEAVVSKNLLAQEDRLYRTTSTGLEFIEKFREVQSILGESALNCSPIAF